MFLAGTNDLAWGQSVAAIHAAITTVTGIPLERGAKVLLMTVPECEARIETLDAERDALNALIKGDKREGVYVLQFYLPTYLPSLSMNPMIQTLERR